MSEFAGNNSDGVAWTYALAAWQRMCQHTGAPVSYRKDFRKWLVMTYPGRWNGHGGSTACPPRSPSLNHTSSCKDAGRSMFTPSLRGLSKISWQVSGSCVYSRCQHLKTCSRECPAAHCRVPWNWGPRRICRPIVTTKTHWFNHFIAWTVTCISKNKSLRI